jgi:hypothetical protein
VAVVILVMVIIAILVSAALRKDAKHATRPSGVSNFHDAAGQVLRGGVAATFGASQRAVGEGSPERGVRAKPRWFGAYSAESGHEEQNILSQDLTRGSRKNTNAKDLTRASRRYTDAITRHAGQKETQSDDVTRDPYRIPARINDCTN